MANCPLCHAAVKDDFGLLECEGCGAQLIVHMDGRVEYQDAKVPELIAEEELPGEPSAHVHTHSDAFVFPDQAMEFELELPAVVESSNEDEIPTDFTFQESTAGDAADELVEDAGRDESPHEVPDPFENADSDLAPEPAAAVYNSGAPDSPDLGDIAGFGNSDLSGGREGSLRYTVFIEGIDTSDLRNAFREAITDRKFMWDTDQILRSLRHGQVTISNVSASKAFILISRLRSMPVKIRWEQYAVHQT